MLFNSYSFIFAFLPVTFALFFVVGRTHETLAASCLALTSVFFYAYWSLESLPVLLISICGNYFVGCCLTQPALKYRKVILVSGVSANLLALGYFKYTDFLLANINAVLQQIGCAPIPLLHIALPIGISFFTFTQIAFLVDSYQGKVSERSLVHYILFVTFFPHLIAGPIIHHKPMMRQFANLETYRLNPDKIAIGISLFTLGLAKKLLLADPFGEYANLLFEATKSGLAPAVALSWAGSVAYTFQLYFDFSGYSDMAVGLSLLFGISLPINFDGPLRATNIIDFWQRWHISLTHYINQYLYTPFTLFGMRCGYGKPKSAQTLCSLVAPTMSIFLIVGLWHGASWNYVVFGGMHGAMMVINHLWRKRTFWKRPKSKNSRLASVFAWAITFACVNAAFVMFRSDSIATAFKIYKGMAGGNGIRLPASLAKRLGGIVEAGLWQDITLGAGQSTLQFAVFTAVAFTLILCLPSTATLTPQSPKASTTTRLLTIRAAPVLVGLLFVFSVLNLGKTSAFLYFQF